MRDAILALAVLAAVVIGGRYLFRRRPGSAPLHVPSVDGTFTLMPPRKNGVLLGVTALVPAALLAAVTFQGWKRGGPAFAFGVVATLVAAGAAAFLFASAFRSRLVVRETGVERVGVFRRRLIGWLSIAKIDYNPVQHWFFITTSDGAHLWLPADLAGIGNFASLALRRMRPAVIEAGGPMLRDVLEKLAGRAERDG